MNQLFLFHSVAGYMPMQSLSAKKMEKKTGLGTLLY